MTPAEVEALKIETDRLKKIAGGAHIFVDPPSAGEDMRMMAVELLALRAEVDRLTREREEARMHHHKLPCYYCGKPIDSLSGNPTRWGIGFPHADDPGRVKAHHIGCLLARIEESDSLRAQLARFEEVVRAATNYLDFTGHDVDCARRVLVTGCRCGARELRAALAHARTEKK